MNEGTMATGPHEGMDVLVPQNARGQAPEMTDLEQVASLGGQKETSKIGY